MQTAVIDAEVHHAFIDPLRRTGCAPSRQQVSAEARKVGGRPVFGADSESPFCAGGNAVIHARIGGEMEDVDIHIVNGEVVEKSLWVHFAVPPRAAWDNVHHFCGTVLPFRQAADVQTWSNRHGIPAGSAVLIPQVQELGREWYTHHCDRNWRKWSVAEAMAIFERVSFEAGAFWSLESREGSF